MGRFVYGNALNDELDKLIKGANKFLFLVSPYIKLHDRLKDELRKLPHKESLSLMLLFGKNEDNVARSLKLEHLEFFKKEFPNVEIRHEPRLHAKYYANDSTSILTSMNLYDFSMINNIESGTVYDDRFNIGKKTGRVAYDYFLEVFDGATLLYHQSIDVKSSLGGLRKRYGSIRIMEDNLHRYYGGGTSRRYTNTTRTYQQNGYCIRTGQTIPFNIERPLSSEAYRTWSSFSNPDYPEDYCHYSGEASYGKTSYNRPVLQQYWRIARNHL